MSLSSKIIYLLWNKKEQQVTRTAVMVVQLAIWLFILLH